MCCFLATSMFFVTGCNDNNDPPPPLPPSGAFDGIVRAQVESGEQFNDAVRRVTAQFWYEFWCEYWEWWRDSVVVLAYAPFANRGFTLALPSEVNSRFLRSFGQNFMEEWYDENEWGFDRGRVSITLSDIRTRERAIFNFRGHPSASGDINEWEQNAHFMLVSGAVNENDFYFSEAVFVYVDRDVNMIGSGAGEWKNRRAGVIGTWENNWSASLKRGWNIIYRTETESVVEDGDFLRFHETWTVTTTPISGLRWYERDYFWNSLYNATTSSIRKMRTQSEHQNEREHFCIFGSRFANRVGR